MRRRIVRYFLKTGQIIPLKRGSSFNDNDLKYILREIEDIKKERS